MKSFYRHAGVTALLAVASLGITLHGATSSSAGSATSAAISERASDVKFPYLLPLTFEVESADHRDLSSLKNLTVTAQRTGEEQPTTVVGPVNPFAGDNTCASPAPAGIAHCAVNADATVGTLRVNWEVPQAGTYRFVISAKRGGEERVDTIAVFDLEAATN